MANEEPEVITMVRCCYCGDEWCREDIELVCDKCTPTLNADFAIADLMNAINNIEGFTAAEIKPRLNLLVFAHSKLSTIVEKVKK